MYRGLIIICCIGLTVWELFSKTKFSVLSQKNKKLNNLMVKIMQLLLPAALMMDDDLCILDRTFNFLLTLGFSKFL